MERMVIDGGVEAARAHGQNEGRVAMSSTWGEQERLRLIELLQEQSLRLGSFTLASGRTSHYYVDGRKVTLSAEGARLIALGILNLLVDHPEVSAVGGLTLGADPIVGATLALAPT